MRTNVVRALSDVVATKHGIILFLSFFLPFHLLFSQKGFAYDFWSEKSVCTRTLCVRARADIVATKLRIILLFPRTFLPEGVCLGS